MQRELSRREPRTIHSAITASTRIGAGLPLARVLPAIAEKEINMLGTILILILILALLGALPRWSHSRDWGYAPTGGVGLILFVVVILLVLGRI